MEDSTQGQKEEIGAFLLDPSEGGKARAKKLDQATRSEIARRAAEARWQKMVPTATHDGTLDLSGFRLECAVLPDGTRVLKQKDIMEALGRSGSTGRRIEGLPPFLEAANLSEFISADLRNHVTGIEFRAPGQRFISTGYEAIILPEICDVFLAARQDPSVKLSAAQERFAERAEILMRSLAKVGIVALVDEATGYEKVKERNELQRLLAEYVEESFRPWVRKFPDEFFNQVLRVYGHEKKYTGNRRPQFVGKFINEYIYNQFPEGTLDELQRVNPVRSGGSRSRAHHQHLTEGTGNIHLDRQITIVTTLLTLSRNPDEFKQYFAMRFPKKRAVLKMKEDPNGEMIKLFEDEDFE